MVQIWSEWAGSMPLSQDRIHWNGLVERAQPTRRPGDSPQPDLVGRPVSEWDALQLEVHPAIEGDEGLPSLPAYVERQHDVVLREKVSQAASGTSVMVMLVGGSSTGKTRACWEAIQHLPEGWKLWHPISPNRAAALTNALEQNLVGPQTVIWLNESINYLGISKDQIGERVASGLRELLRSRERGPVLILGTLWPEHWDLLTGRPRQPESNPHPQVRELLVGTSVIVPEEFSGEDLVALSDLATHDSRLGNAMARSRQKITQHLAGGFELVSRYEAAPPSARAVMNAALDARRLNRKAELTKDFLYEASHGYMDDSTWDALDEGWFASALAYAARPCLGVNGPLVPIRPRPGAAVQATIRYRLADYLEHVSAYQRRIEVPPTSFWEAMLQHTVAGDELVDIAYESQSRGLFRLATQFYLHAADHGESQALLYLADHRERNGDIDAARQALEIATIRDVKDSWYSLACLYRKQGDLAAAEAALAQEEESLSTVGEWAVLREEVGDMASAKEFLQRAVDLGSYPAMLDMARFYEREGNEQDAVKLRAKAEDSNSVIRELIDAVDAVREVEEARERIIRGWIEECADDRELRAHLEGILRTSGRPDDLIHLMKLRLSYTDPSIIEPEIWRVLGAGCMHESGRNEAIEMLAGLEDGRGNHELATRMMKYGFEPNGRVADPWTVQQFLTQDMEIPTASLRSKRDPNAP
ncbi:tetratricopeptide (TPR) repeat protein [Actinomadura coerulea]|uniref:Tetratricopeptide (TPR) repeat protein n=1 Tax=Actinomadura coerulea TaxID=46159 RepID=A0A7X0KZI5_9ACTN|nr:hypothetical protein [Actinomadura coerulea]MBB6396199.1 tetratricopeptide (TPR) repeat protein [Actinomadura coerulea]